MKSIKQVEKSKKIESRKLIPEMSRKFILLDFNDISEL